MIKRHQLHQALITPVIFQQSCWRNYFGNYIEVTPKDHAHNLVPVAKWPDQEEGIAVAANAISSSIGEWFGIEPTSPFAHPPTAGDGA